MALQLFNGLAQIDLAMIDPAEVLLLSDDAQARLQKLIAAVETREAATERLRVAQARVVAAVAEQSAALEAHQNANPPPDRITAMREAQEAYRKSNT